ncbi:hypothetical protein [Sphingobacterium suaedae]|uniref:Uncharacterized protein n=1 Tax=Sphingobacterium suaedae TaxID=1686402 RepID=A0ABW5KGW1_9SPHI
MENLPEKFMHIKGWGVDADPLNEPTYPMRNADAEGTTALWERPQQQQPFVEILHSNERPNLSAVFGDTLPPQGLSGHIRRFAFQHSESRYRHWLPLLFADRINELEGLIDDIQRGKWPNIFRERGWKARWKYQKKDTVVKAAGILIVLVCISLYRKKTT